MLKMLRKIISGGQTGADRAVLDFAIETGLEHGGYVPRSRKAEDGRIDERYNLVELSTSSYPVRTRRNIEESDGAGIFSLEPGNDVAPKSGQESKLNDSREAMNDTNSHQAEALV